MLGKIELIQFVILGVSALATFTDLRFGKIYNWLTVPTAIAALLASYFFSNWVGVGQALFSLVLGMALYGWLFGLRIMGGGDVKLLMALGAWGGPEYTIEVAVLGILVGGVLALVLLTVTGRLPGFIRRFYHFLLTLFVKNLEVELPKVDKSFTMPFGIPLCIAAVWVAFADPFVYFGLLNGGLLGNVLGSVRSLPWL